MITQEVTPITPLPSFLAPERPAAVDNLVEAELPLLTKKLAEVISQINSTETNINAKETSVTEKYNDIQPHFDNIDLIGEAILSGDLPTIIDDNDTSNLKTWSSEKINSKIDIHSKTAKTTPVDADEIMVADSTSAWSLKKITWANIKTALTSFFTPRVVTTTNKAIARFGNTTGDLQNSAITIDDNGNIGSGAQSFNGFGGSGFKNHIINGNFDIWQRGTSFSASGFTADRWILTANVNSQRISLSPAETDLTGTAYALRFNAGTYVSYKIEDVRTLAGKKATLSFWSRSGASKTLYNLYLRQHFGTSGSAYVDTAFSSTTFNNTTGLTKYTFTVTLPTIVGKTISSDNTHYIEIFFESQNDGIYTDITRVQFEEGSIATPFENRHYGLELSLCQRYCFNPKYGADIANQVIRGDAYSEDAVNGWANFKFPVPMRITPSLYLSAGVTQLYIGYPDSIQLIALSQSAVSCNEAVFTYTASSVSVDNKHYNLYIPNSADKILFIAEL